MNAKFEMQRVEDDTAWDVFVRSSKEGTIFVESVYLEAVSGTFERFFILKGQERCAAIVVMMDRAGHAALHNHVIHHGLMYAKEPEGRSRAKRHSERFNIAEYLASELPKRYQTITLALPPKVIDMRPFLWFNYGGPPEVRWKLDLRYTSYLNIEGCGETDLEQNPLFEKLGTSRRQEVRYARRDGVKAEKIQDLDVLLDLYQRTMGKSGTMTTVSLELLGDMKYLIKHLMDAGAGAIYGVKDPEGKIVSATFFCWDNKRAYWLFGGNHPEKKGRYCGTVVLWDAFRDMNRNGITEVDLEGINSPWRGWFKLSFGGTISPYYEIQYDGTSS